MAVYTDHQRALRQAHSRKRRDNMRRNIWAIKAEQGCADCGIKDPRVLEFDHVRGNKAGNVSVMVSHGLAWARILEEIAKCEVRCANCHVLVTAERGGHWAHALEATSE